MKLSHIERAWLLYCEETAGDMDVRDFWRELPAPVQQLYLNRTRADHDEMENTRP